MHEGGKLTSDFTLLYNIALILTKVNKKVLTKLQISQCLSNIFNAQIFQIN